MNEKNKGISGYTLKMIAVITMLIDHTAAIVLDRMPISITYSFQNLAHAEPLAKLYFLMRIVGRMAFPIYCFLLVEGFKYTKSKVKYLLRLLIFAFISEVPFDLAFKGELTLSYNNVFFTLFFGLLCMMITEWIDTHVSVKDIWNPVFVAKICDAMVMIAIALFCTYVFRTDYAALGIMCIMVMYFQREERLVGFGLGVLILVFSSYIEAAAFLMLIPIKLYNGSRGRQVNKYLFYGFYPAHILILYLIAVYGMGLPA